MKYSGRINRRYPAGFTRAVPQPRNRRGSLFFAPCAFFAIPGAFFFWKEWRHIRLARTNEKTKRASRLTRPNDNNIQTKTMKTLHSLAVGLRPAFLILARRIAFRCFYSLPGWCSCNRARVRAGLGRRPAASSPHAIITRRPCCPTARCSSQAE